MKQSKLPFFAIIGAAVLVVIGMAGVSSFVTASLDLPAAPGQANIDVVVAPPLKSWANKAARDFNQANPNTQVTIIEAGELVPLTQLQPVNPETTPPAAWLAEASFVLEMAANQGAAFEKAQSVASTPMAWGVYNSKLDLFNGELSWQAINTVATGPSGVKLVIDKPANSAQGLAALISATAAHLNKDTLSASDISAADGWLTGTFGNRNTLIPATPASDFATKGVSAGDAGILSMAAWQTGRLHERPDFTLTPTRPEVILDYPFAIRSNSRPEAKAVAQAFKDYLLAQPQQEGLATLFFDPASANAGGVQLDGVAAQRLLDWATRQLR